MKGSLMSEVEASEIRKGLEATFTEEERHFDTSSSTALYVQLADVLREKIYSKEWPFKSRIPSEHELMTCFAVSRGTVRHAIKMLVDEQLLIQNHGRGTFVAEPGLSHSAGSRPFSFAETLRDHGKDFSTEILDKRVIPAPIDVANELEIKTGNPVMFLRRLRIVDGEPIICQESWENLNELPDIDHIDLTNVSLFNAVEQCSGRHVKYSDMRYSARIVGKEHAGYLDCEDTASVLILEQLIRLDNYVPIEWSSTWLKPGQAIITSAVQP